MTSVMSSDDDRAAPGIRRSWLGPHRFRGPPPSTEGVVQLHQREKLVQLRLRQTELGREGPRVAVQDFEIARRPSPVALVRQSKGIPRRNGQKLLLLAEFAVLAVPDQRIGDLAERLLDGLLVHDQRLFLLRFGELDSRGDPAASEDRLRQRSEEAPDTGRAFEEVAQRGALRPAAGGQRNRGKERRPCDADACVRGDEPRLLQLDVGPPLQESRRKPRRDDGIVRLLGQFPPARDRSGIPGEQDADEVLLLLAAALDVDDGLRGIVDELLGLADIQEGDRPLALLQLDELEGLLPRGECPLGNLELEIERQQLVIPAGDAGDEAGDHRLAVPLGGEQIGARRLGGATELAPEIELPGSRYAALEEIGVDRRREARRRDPLASGREGERHRGKLIGPGDPQLGAGLLDARRRDQDVLVLRQRGANQIGDHGIGKDLRPVLVGQRLGAASLRAATIALRRLGGRTLVVGSDRAPSREQHQRPGPFHGVGSGSVGSCAAGCACPRRFANRSTSTNSTGMMKMAMAVAASMPVITTVPRICRAIAPAPVATQSGIMPKMNANEVMRIGRRRSRAPSSAASTSGLPFFSSSRANSTMRMAFLAARPMSIANPIWAKIPRSKLRSKRPRKAPRTATGTDRSTENGGDQLS